jgi:hypothetical protein
VAEKTPASAPGSPLKTTQPASPVGRAKAIGPLKGASSVTPPFAKLRPSTRSGPGRYPPTLTVPRMSGWTAQW